MSEVEQGTQEMPEEGKEVIMNKPMKNGECRRTRSGRKYCMRNGKVRFVKGK